MSRLRGNRRPSETSNIEEITSDDHTRQLCSTAHMDKLHKELSEVYLTKSQKHIRAYNKRKQTDNNFPEGLITNVKDTLLQTRISQLEALTIIVSKLDTSHCYSVKLVKKRLAQLNRAECREDIIDAKKLI